MKSKRNGVLMGGLSAERSVSMESGEAVYEALASRGYDVTRILVDRDIDQTLRSPPLKSPLMHCTEPTARTDAFKVSSKCFAFRTPAQVCSPAP